MRDEIRIVLERLLEGHDASAEEMHTAIGAVMDGQTSEVEFASLLTALRMKGEAVSEIVGAARAMQERATKIADGQTGLLDTCGTGGDELCTFNISTAAAFVAAAAGIPVAKHGNRSVSSSSGSADVLESLGVNIQLTPEKVTRCLSELGICFCFAPLIHGAMKHAAPVRKQLKFRTIFNLLGPLTNPARAEYQLIGANRIVTAEKLAQALSQLGRKKAIVVCGADELDEVSLWGETTAFVVQDDSVTSEIWTAATFGLSPCNVADLRVESADESAQVIRGVFAGSKGAARDIVIANAAAALMAAEGESDPKSAASRAADAIDSGRAKELCQKLAQWSNG